MTVSQSDLGLAYALVDAGYVLHPTKDKLPAGGVLWSDPTYPGARSRADVDLVLSRVPDADGFAVLSRHSQVEIVDLDVKNGKDGAAWWSAQGMPESPMAGVTKSGGRHLYFRRRADGQALRQTASAIAPGVDTRGSATNGYVVAVGYGRTLSTVVPVAQLPELPDAVLAAMPAPKLREPGELGQVVKMTEAMMRIRLDDALAKVVAAGRPGDFRGLLYGAAKDARRVANAGVMTDGEATELLRDAVRSVWGSVNGDDERWISDGWHTALESEVWEIGDPETEWFAAMAGVSADELAARFPEPRPGPTWVDGDEVAAGTPGSGPARRKPKRKLPSPGSPMDVVDALLQDPELRNVMYYNESWMNWAGDRYATVPDSAIRALLYNATANAFYVKDGTEVKWAPNTTRINNLMDVLRSVRLLDSTWRPGDWLDGNPRPKRGEYIACRNGLVRLADKTLHDPTPMFFNTVASPFEYTETGPEPERWLAFLRSVWPDEVGPGGVPVPATEIRTLKQWFGYVLSGRNEQQKGLSLIGPRRSGKGTIIAVLEQLVGTAGVTSFTMASLSNGFGLADMVGKSLAVSPDVRWPKREADMGMVVGSLLSIISGDPVPVELKRKNVFTAKLDARVMLASNDSIPFHDPSGTIASRFITLRMKKGFYGEEDFGLKDALLAESPAILRWALDGLADLDREGRFTLSEQSKHEAETSEEDASPVLEFVKDVCDVTGDFEDFVSRSELYDAWNGWRALNGVSFTVSGVGKLIKDMQAADPRCLGQRSKAVPGGSPIRGTRGVRLRPMSARDKLNVFLSMEAFKPATN